MEAPNVRNQLRRVLADRRSPEARELLASLSRFAATRASTAARQWGDTLDPTGHEAIVAEVLLRLLQGGLATFRGSTVPELLQLVRRTTDQAARQWLYEQNPRVRAPIEPRSGAASTLRAPEDDPLPLTQLLLAQSHRRNRAAVTRRLQQIRSRIGDAPHARSPGPTVATEPS